jgi:hypothetical protein
MSLGGSQLDHLDVRREAITEDMFNRMKANTLTLHPILPPQKQFKFDFR